MPLDIHYKFDMAVKPGTPLSRRIYWAGEAQKDLDLIHEYHNQTQTHGKEQTDSTAILGTTGRTKKHTKSTH